MTRSRIESTAWRRPGWGTGGSVKSALVLGGGGFLGSHLTERLKQEGYWVRCVDVHPPKFGVVLSGRASSRRPARPRRLPARR